nr:hypothetical protein [Clostridia bacterium]
MCRISPMKNRLKTHCAKSSARKSATERDLFTAIMFGRYLESNSKNKTGEAIRKLMDLAPKIAIVIRDGEEKEIQVKDIIKGDTIIAKPGETIAVDGVVIEGSTTIDESMLTGES